MNPDEKRDSAILIQKAAAGAQAREVLDNEQFQNAFAAIKKEIIEQWERSPARDSSGREALWAYLSLLKKVEMHLRSTMESGKLAEITLQHRQTMRDRAKGWVQGWTS